MGQAKSKGTYEQRRDSAIQAARARFPQSVKCNNCGADLTDIHSMDVRNMPGMRLAGGALCESCSSVTWVVDGEPDALQRFNDLMAAQHGQDATVGR